MSRKVPPPMEPSSRTWDVARAQTIYNIAQWGDGYFDVSARGHLLVRPDRDPGGPVVDLFELARDLHRNGQPYPVLVRFTDILHDRVDRLCRAFDQARERHGYRGGYTAAYPIKVNQQRRVVETILQHGGPRVGLEAGSKPELLAALALAPAGALVVCNGYKDREYVRLALIGQRLDVEAVLVVEKQSELDLVIAAARDLGLRPRLGVRVRLSSIGAGNWQNTGGERGKFGLLAHQLQAVTEQLRAADMLDCLGLLHFHIGSQIPNILDFQKALQEGARYYAQLHRLGAKVDSVDVGGGLGVDYEGSQSRSYCSMNYGLEEYAHTVVQALAHICSQADLPQPRIVTESGRAMTAHHAVLVTNVIDVEQAPGDGPAPRPEPADPPLIGRLAGLLADVGTANALPIYHEAAHHLSEAREMFTYGLLELEARARAEHLYYAICRGVQAALDPGDPTHREALEELNDKLADKYFCNFSLFQSMPDAWAIEQIFPIAPLHRLREPPQRRAVLQDLTCDSDGRVRRYVDSAGVENSLPVHGWNPNEPYLIGVFMVGAYQEILGDMHNLFGDTGSVNVQLQTDGRYSLLEPHRGDTVAEVLRYVHIDAAELRGIYRARLQAGELSTEERARCLAELSAGLDGYTYLED